MEGILFSSHYSVLESDTRGCCWDETEYFDQAG